MFITTSSDMEWEEIAGKLASHDSTKSIDKGKYNRIQITQKNCGSVKSIRSLKQIQPLKILQLP